MATIAAQLVPVIEKLGIDVEVSVVLTPAETYPCPCAATSPWRQYSPEWHQAHPEVPDCKGLLVQRKDAQDVTGTTKTIHAIVLPHWSETGQMVASITPGQIHNWEWLCITQVVDPFTHLKMTDSTGYVYLFSVSGRFPFLLEGSTVPTVLLYHLTPITLGA